MPVLLLAVSCVRLLLVCLLLIYLPGLIITRRLGRTREWWFVIFVGLGLHELLLSFTVLLSQHPSTVVWAVAGETVLISGLVLWQTRRPLRQEDALGTEHGRRGKGTILVAVIGLCLAAAVVRFTHNYHFDDFQHILYLTELNSRADLFLPDLSVNVRHFSGPVITGSLLAERYSFWGPFYIVLTRLSGTALGDTYFFVGIANLFLCLVTVGWLLREWLDETLLSIAGLFAFVAAWPWVSDDLGNFGAYPLQMGKLMASVAILALVIYGIRRERKHAILAVIAASSALFFDLNDAIGVVFAVLVAVVVACAPLRRFKLDKQLLRIGAATAVIVLLVAAGSLSTGGFIMWAPDGTPAAAAEATAVMPAATPTRAAAIAHAAGTVPGFEGRAWLFFHRSLPLEIAVALLVVMALRLLAGKRRRLSLVFAGGVAVICASFVMVFWSGETIRQLGVVTFKPGYFTSETAVHALMRAEPSSPLLIDEVTAAYLRSAGWQGHDLAPFDRSAQTFLMLAYHPMISGAALQRLLAGLHARTIVVNEQVLGPGVAEKFRELPGVREERLVGDEAPEEHSFRDALERLGDDTYSLDYVRFAGSLRTASTDFARLLFRRPVTMFSVPPLAAASSGDGLVASVLGALKIGPGDKPATGNWPFMNSVLVVADVPVQSCSSQLSVGMRAYSTFDDTVLVNGVVVTGDSQQHVAGDTRVYPSQGTELQLHLKQPVCSDAQVRLFANGGPSYDFRFVVDQVGLQ